MATGHNLKMIIFFSVLFNGLSISIDFTFEVDSGTTQCVDVLAVDDDILENPDIREAMILTDDTSVQLIRPITSFVIVDNDGRLIVWIPCRKGGDSF